MTIQNLTDQVTNIKLQQKLNEVVTPINTSVNNLSNYITTNLITVDPSGTGDFTTLNDAIQYLSGKWASNVLRIYLVEGTHTITTPVTISGGICSIPNLVIYGAGIDKTFIESTVDRPIRFEDRCNGKIRDLTFISAQNEQISISTLAHATVQNIKIQSNVRWGIYVRQADLVFQSGNYICSGGTCALSSDCGRVIIDAVNLQHSNMTYSLSVSNGGLIQVYLSTRTFSNVTNNTNKTMNSLSSAGLIMGTFKN